MNNKPAGSPAPRFPTRREITLNNKSTLTLFETPERPQPPNRSLGELIDDGEREVEESLPFNPELQRKIAGKIIENNVVKKVSKKHNLSKINLGYEIEQFLFGFSSRKTVVGYNGCLSLFTSYCSERGIDPLDISTLDADGYMNYLTVSYSTATVRLNVAALGSFYRGLHSRYPDSFQNNPFHQKRLPRLVKVRRIDFPTTKDIQTLKQELDRIERKDIFCAVSLMEKYGFRVGIFEHLVVSDSGRWVSVSKGKDMAGKFTKKETNLIQKSGILGKKPTTISTVIVRYSKKLFEDGKTSCPFSVHDIRRYFIEREGEKFDIRGFVEFSKTLHRSPMTTIGYLY